MAARRARSSAGGGTGSGTPFAGDANRWPQRRQSISHGLVTMMASSPPQVGQRGLWSVVTTMDRDDVAETPE